MTHFYKWQCKNPFSNTHCLKIIKNVSFWNFKHTTIDLNQNRSKMSIDHNQKWDFCEILKHCVLQAYVDESIVRNSDEIAWR